MKGLGTSLPWVGGCISVKGQSSFRSVIHVEGTVIALPLEMRWPPGAWVTEHHSNFQQQHDEQSLNLALRRCCPRSKHRTVSIWALWNQLQFFWGVVLVSVKLNRNVTFIEK